MQTVGICKRVITSLQTCTFLVTFANIIYNVCKHSRHYANVHMYPVVCCGGLMEECMVVARDWWDVRGGMRQSNFFYKCCMWRLQTSKVTFTFANSLWHVCKCQAFAHARNITTHVQMLNICKHVIMSLQMCKLLFMFANIIYIVCKYLRHMQRCIYFGYLPCANAVFLQIMNSSVTSEHQIVHC